MTNDSYSGVCAEVPEVREIYGGTVFKVTFDENCPVELQSAFNYACKIWEENALTCHPINISVNVDKIRTFGSNKALSNVRYRVIYFENENGTTRSNTITVPPVAESIDQNNISIKIEKHRIIIDPDKLNWEKISYRIDYLSPLQTVIPIKRLAKDGIIDISQLQKGAYALTIFEDGEYKTSKKFMH